MQNYKTPDNSQPSGFSLHNLSAQDIDNGGEKYLPAGSVPITDEEASAIRAANAPKPTTEQMRAERDAKLAACDWTQLPDAPLTVAQKAALAAYRQALRDVTAQAGFPASVNWPVVPA